MADPTGEADKGALRLDFDRRLLLQFRGTTITSDGGLLAYRELEDTFRLTDAGADRLADARTGKNGRHRLAGLLRRPAARNGPTAMAFCSYWARFAVAQAAHRYDPGFETAGNLANVGGHGFVATWFLCTLLATLFLPITASAGDQENSTGKLADSGGLPLSSPQSPADRSESTPRWSVSAEAIVLGRTGGVNQSLVGLLPGSMKFDSTAFSSGAEAFNSNQFRQGFSAGPKIDLTYRGDSGYGVEFSYFNIFDQSATKAIGPTNPLDWLVMKAPGAFWQTQDFPYQAMAWKAATNVHSAAANGRLDLSSRVTILAGFRWLQLKDNLQGTLPPSDRSDPTWKTPPNDYTLLDLVTLPPVGSGGTYPPFWTTSTTNNLYGAQIGVDGKIWELGRLSLDGQVKVGVFNNNAEQSTGVSLEKTVYPVTATANHAAFASEASLQVKYQLTNGLALKAGYEVLWLDGVALAPGQIRKTYTASTIPPNVRALGVNCGSNILFQGATLGLEYSF